MDAELKTKWVAALRSGEYKQGKYLLKSKDGYCCLGVLGEVAGYPFDPSGEGLLCLNDNYSMYGLDHTTQKMLSERNDEGQSFTEIADYIEANL